jgi:hypothetical protein
MKLRHVSQVLLFHLHGMLEVFTPCALRATCPSLHMRIFGIQLLLDAIASNDTYAALLYSLHALMLACTFHECATGSEPAAFSPDVQTWSNKSHACLQNVPKFMLFRKMEVCSKCAVNFQLSSSCPGG